MTSSLRESDFPRNPKPASESDSPSNGNLESASRPRAQFPPDPNDDLDSVSRGGYSAAPRLRVGDYELLKRVGVGAQGEVWQALALGPIKRVVALKLLAAPVRPDAPPPTEPHAPDPDAANPARHHEPRVGDQAIHQGRLTHPAILPVLDFGSDAGRTYYTMPFVDGFTLAQVLDQRWCRVQGRLPREMHALAVAPEPEYRRRVVAVLLTVARALHAAHEARVVHRDVKPGNILLARDGPERVFLSDFGLAREVPHGFPALPARARSAASDPASAPRTPTHTLGPGTPAYMAPERLAGRERVDEFKADQYALGVALYEALLLRKPRNAPENLPIPAKLEHLARQTPPRPRELDPSIHPDLEAVVLKAIDPDPLRRYESVAELADDLERFRRGDPVRARQPGPFRAFRRAVHRQRFRLLLLAVVLAAALVYVAFQRSTRDARLAWTRAAVAELLWANDVEEAARVLQRAAPDLGGNADPDYRALVANLGPDLVRVGREARDTFDVLRLARLRALVEELPLDPGPRQRFRDAVRPLAPARFSSDPPGAVVVVRPLAPVGGRPVEGKPAAVLRAGSLAAPVERPDLFEGAYWITAYLPDDSPDGLPRVFVERAWDFGTALDDESNLHILLEPALSPAAAERNRSMVRFPAGSFPMGVDDPRYDEHPPVRTSVHAFEIDPHEVTYEDYFAHLRAVGMAFVEESYNPLRRFNTLAALGVELKPGENWRKWPVTGITHQEAARYAAWRGCRLPAEEELEWAARYDRLKSDPEIPWSQANPAVPAEYARHRRARWRDLYAVDSPASLADRVLSDDGRPVYGLFGNAAEITQFLYSPLRESNRRRRSAEHARYANVVRSGVVEINRDGAIQLELLGYVQRQVLLKGVGSPTIGFRCARSVQPLTRLPAPDEIPPPPGNPQPAPDADKSDAP